MTHWIPELAPDHVAKLVSGPVLDAVLRSVAAGCSVRSIASEIQEAATRIAGLVTAVKGFTHMDQARVAEPVDLTNSLGYTVAILNAIDRFLGRADVNASVKRWRG